MKNRLDLLADLELNHDNKGKMAVTGGGFGSGSSARVYLYALLSFILAGLIGFYFYGSNKESKSQDQKRVMAENPEVKQQFESKSTDAGEASTFFVLQEKRVQGARQSILNASGYVTARRRATVSSKTTSRINEVLVEEGMLVKQGQILAVLDVENEIARQKLSESQLESTIVTKLELQVGLLDAERKLKQAKTLWEKKLTSKDSLDNAELSVQSFNARLAKVDADISVAKNQVNLMKQQLKDAEIRAPFSGVVIAKAAQPGEIISPITAGGSFTRTGICTIVDMSSLEVEVEVSESYINRVTPNQPVIAVLNSYPNWDIPAKVITIIPSANRAKATVKVRIGFDDIDPKILPDMGVNASFLQSNEELADTTPIYLVPKSAVQWESANSYVFVRQGKSFNKQAVVVKNADSSGRYRVTQGIKVGDEVALNGQTVN